MIPPWGDVKYCSDDMEGEAEVAEEPDMDELGMRGEKDPPPAAMAALAAVALVPPRRTM